MVNVKQIIKYGEKTTEKLPTVLRQHMLIRYGCFIKCVRLKKNKDGGHEGIGEKHWKQNKVTFSL